MNAKIYRLIMLKAVMLLLEMVYFIAASVVDRWLFLKQFTGWAKSLNSLQEQIKDNLNDD